MSLENEARSSLDESAEKGCKTQRQSKLSYTREFLLNLNELEVCKKLPKGFDESLLSEFADAAPSIQDRQRIHSSAPLQGFRRTEYGSSPPTRGDQGNYSRGAYGRWDNRSSGRGDRDLDTQSDRDTDSARRYGNQSRRSWQGPEHDGLLGSGSLPRPSGFGGGVSAPKFRSNDQYQLNRSNEPYHPPRPFKAASLSRRETNDSYNDETFGSIELTSEDRAEEEKRRRASFEFMRKEQQMAMQEKQKLDLNKHPTHPVFDMSELLVDGREEKNVSEGSNKLDVTTSEGILNVDQEKSILPSQNPACRPLVPPGFTNMVTEKESGLKSMSRADSAEAGKNEKEKCLVSASEQSGKSVPEASASTQCVDQQIFLPFINKGKQSEDSCKDIVRLGNTTDKEKHKLPASVISDTHKGLDDVGMVELNSDVTGLNIDGESKNKIFGKILGDSLLVNVSKSMDSIEIYDDKTEKLSTHNASHSSKFAHWFVEEEREATHDISSSSPNDLLTLIVRGNKGRLDVFDDKPLDNFAREFSPRSSEGSNKSMANLSSAINGVSESVPNCIKQEAVPSILTCEDLEQTILSEYGESSSNKWPHLEGGRGAGATSEWQRPRTDDLASQHLLSLLNKGSSLEKASSEVHADTNSPENATTSMLHGLGAPLREPTEEDAKNIKPNGNTLTLEALFGTAFMKELQSAEAPVSAQRGSVGTAEEDKPVQHSQSFPVSGNGLFSSAADRLESEKDSTLFGPNNGQQIQLHKTEKWMGFDDPLIDLNLSELQPSVASNRRGFDGALEFQLPEEDSLISAVNVDSNPQLSKFIPGENLNQIESFVSNAPGDIRIAEKLGALGAVLKEERPPVGIDGLPFAQGPYNLADGDSLYRDFRAQTSTSYFQSMHMNQGKPLFPPLDPRAAHMDPRMKFMGAESMIQHEASSNKQLSANMLRASFQRPNMGLNSFDLATHHPMLPQMQMHGDYPPHVVNEFQRGALVPHLSNQAPGFIHEHNPMRGHTFGYRQSNVGGRGMPVPAPEFNGGTGHPEAFQRLVEMELRANSRRIPPFAAGRSQGMHGTELDILRYR